VSAHRGDYDIRLDAKFGPLELIDVATVNEAVVRLGVIEGDFHWHKHDDQDELFLVLEGRLVIDVEGRDSVTLEPSQAYTVPRGVMHCTHAPERTTILMVEAAGVVPTGD
jgi:mannose-6-phosphate isomerase-like protein (cupin superfamily)